jgi:chemotaxis protein methyltransferase CheR
MLKTVIPEWSKENLKVFRVWSAAASTGEEPYTLAMILSRHLPKGKDFSIVATDIDTNVLKKAKNAVYPISKQEEIPREYYLSSIEVGHGKAEGWFRIKQALKDKIKFKPYNLIGPIPLDEGVFDLVLCRNVMIYFTQENIDYVQDKIYTLTKENGYFFIGHSESLHGIKHKWTSKGPATYKKE